MTNSPRPVERRWSGPLAGGVAVAGLIVLGLAMVSWSGRSPGWAYDFNAYYDAALRLIATGSPYQAETLSGPFRPGPYGLYLYSPILAILFAPLTALGAQAAILVWLGLRTAILALTCALMPVSRTIRVATFGVAALSAPVLVDLNLGNISLIVTFAAVVGWRWLDRPIGALVMAVALTVRPTMGVVLVWWLLRGLWRPVAVTVAALALLVLASLPVVGLGSWFDYATVLRNVSDVTGVPRNVDGGSAALLFGAPAWVAQLALLAGYAIASVAVLLSLRRDRELSYVVAVTATLLLAPLLWDHYLTNMLIPAAFLAARGKPWALALPLLGWLPQLLASFNPALRGVADGVLPFVVLAALLLPLSVPDRGESAGVFVQRMERWRVRRPASA